MSGAGGPRPNGLNNNHDDRKVKRPYNCYGFQMPLHYPKFKKEEYETMPEWKLDCLLKEYGLSVQGDVHEKRKFAICTFVWPDQFGA